MIRLLKRLFDKLEPPANDWVLSRLGGNEAPVSLRSSQVPTAAGARAEQAELAEEMPPSSKGAFDHWFDEAETIEASPPQSRESMSPNASREVAASRDAERRPPSVSGEMVAVRDPERKSRVS